MARHSALVAIVLLLQLQLAVAAELEDARRAIRLRDYDTAVAILRDLSAQGDAEAQFQLAGLYRAGSGVAKIRHWQSRGIET